MSTVIKAGPKMDHYMQVQLESIIHKQKKGRRQNYVRSLACSRVSYERKENKRIEGERGEIKKK